MSRILRAGLFILVTLVILALGVLTSLNHTALEKTDHFETTRQTLDSLVAVYPNGKGDTLQVGWAKTNLTPPFETSLAGYGSGRAQAVRDSIWVRAFLFSNGSHTVALLSPDLLIFPPEVKQRLEDHMSQLGLDAIQYTATHTHHGMGNWQPGLVGKLFAGSYDAKAVDWITQKSIEAIEMAQKDLKRTKIGYAAIQAEDLVYNRLVRELGSIDPWLRFIYFDRADNTHALLTSFAAHPTTIPRDSPFISRDYPGVLVDRLEQYPGIDFAVFVAGAMGSQGPTTTSDPVGIDMTSQIGLTAADQIGLLVQAIQPEYTTTLSHTELNVSLGEPQYRISDTIRLRPWVFNLLFGNYKATISTLHLGDNILIGTPCDFSGELIQPLDSLARSNDLNLMLTSFNGNYIGYITKDSHYPLDAYETRVMNWFGPGNGAYFSSVIRRLIELNAPDDRPIEDRKPETQ